MDCVIINDEGLLYGGFLEGKPTWYKTKRAECVIPEEMAIKVVAQMTELGFKCVHRDSYRVARKWVPTDLAATLNFDKAAS